MTGVAPRRLHLLLCFRYYHGFLALFLAAIDVMSKTEIFLLAMLLIILAVAVWFIFSDEIWVLVSTIETWLYPSFVAPE